MGRSNGISGWFVCQTHLPEGTEETAPPGLHQEAKTKGSASRAKPPSPAEFGIEVCVTSPDYDRSKLRAHALAGVQEVWFILGPEGQIAVHRRPVSGEFTRRTVRGPRGSFTSNAVPCLTVELAAVVEK